MEQQIKSSGPVLFPRYFSDSYAPSSEESRNTQEYFRNRRRLREYRERRQCAVSPAKPRASLLARLVRLVAGGDAC